MSTNELWFTEIMSVINAFLEEGNEVSLSFRGIESRYRHNQAMNVTNTINLAYEEGTTKVKMNIKDTFNKSSINYDCLKTALIQAGVLPIDFSDVEKQLKKASIDMVLLFLLDTNMFILRTVTNYFYQKAKHYQLSFTLLYTTQLIKNELGRLYEKNQKIIRDTLSGENKDFDATNKAQMKLANSLIGLREYELYTSSGLIRNVPVANTSKVASLDVGDVDIYKDYATFIQHTPNHPVYFLTADKAYSARVSAFNTIILRQDLTIPQNITVNIRVLPSLIYTLATMFDEVQLASTDNLWFKVFFKRNKYSYNLNRPWVNLMFSKGGNTLLIANKKKKRILKRLKLLRVLRTMRNDVQASSGNSGGILSEVY